MFQIAKDDVLRGLKRFKRLAKQDILASALTPNPEFWCAQAEARRSQYTDLMEIIDKDGVEAAYRQAMSRYATLPRLASGTEIDPYQAGTRQALELFFAMIGMNADIPNATPESVTGAMR